MQMGSGYCIRVILQRCMQQEGGGGAAAAAAAAEEPGVVGCTQQAAGTYAQQGYTKDHPDSAPSHAEE